jgi:hypothetical protein
MHASFDWRIKGCLERTFPPPNHLIIVNLPLFFTCLGGLKAFSLFSYDEDNVAFHNPKWSI